MMLEQIETEVMTTRKTHSRLLSTSEPVTLTHAENQNPTVVITAWMFLHFHHLLVQPFLQEEQTYTVLTQTESQLLSTPSLHREKK